MRSLLLLLSSLSLLLFSWQKAAAQLAPADDFFNSGAQFYISNNIPQAKEVTEMGLKLYPQDDKLKKLEQLLNQKQQQQQQQNQQQQQQQNQQQNQQSKNDQKNQQSQNQQQKNSQQDQQKQDEQKAQQQKSEQQKKQDQQKQQQQQQAAGDKKDKPQDDNGQPEAADKMTPEEAKRMLNAQKDNEQLLQMKPAEKPQNP